MFCNQQRFDLPTAIVTASVFNSLVDSAQTRWLTTQHRRLREALPSILEGDTELLEQWANDENFIKFCQGQEASRKRAAGGKTKGEAFRALTTEKKLQTYCDSLKKSLPFVIFIATYVETVSASGKLGCWRKQAACRLNGLCVIDFDHIEGDVREVWAEAYSLLSDEDKAFIIRKAEDIPDPLSVALLPATIAYRGAAFLPLSGRIGMLPVYSNVPQINQSESGIDTLKQAIIRYLCLYPHAGMMLKLCVIDPPSVEVIVSMLKALNSDKEFNINGIEISIFHTKEVPASWIEIDDDSLNDGMLGRIKGRRSLNFKLTIAQDRKSVV